MKRVLLSLLLAIVVMSSYAQTKRYYCEVEGVSMDNRFYVTFDFGKQIPENLFRGIEFVDEKTGEVLDFYSVIDAANFMTEKGWHFLQAYSSVKDEKNIVHWIFYKDADNFEKAKEGLTTRDEYKKRKAQKS